MPVPGYRESFPEKVTLNHFLKSESDVIENGRKEKAFQVKQRPRVKKKKVYVMFGNSVSEPVQFKHGGLKRDMARELYWGLI